MASTTITIRQAGEQDLEQLTAFGAQTFYDSFAADNRPEDIQEYIAGAFNLEKQAQELRDPASVFLMAEIQQQMAGYSRLLAGPAPSEVAAKRPVELMRIYAGKEWIGQGVGAALMNACLEEARRRGHDVIWLGVWERNPRAIRFYEKWGFVQVGTHIFQLGADQQKDILMARSLG